jgi:hypothetical protein
MLRDLVRSGGPTRLSDGSYSLKLWLTDTFGTDSQGLRVVDASPDRSRAVREAALFGVAVEVLRRVRNHFPYLAVLYRDKNNDPDIGFGVDIETLRRLTAIATVETSALGNRSHLRPQSSVVVLDLMDTYGLEKGLIETVPPCEYVYVASEQPFEPEVVIESLKHAKHLDDLITRLLASHPVVLVPGADNDYIHIMASNPNVYSRCGLSSAVSEEREPPGL